ncbi:hypothetical protein ACTMTI_52695 [Nonomuraea sp. H19]|uniref:hypothetical protein n=1 Tax=Nonomuraea sp. H19 TaxID=3452206 RepID=UPI003F8AED11
MDAGWVAVRTHSPSCEAGNAIRGRRWDWNETGTTHSPGVQPADVHEQLDRGCQVIMLSRGMPLALQTRPETLDHLRATTSASVVEGRAGGARSFDEQVLFLLKPNAFTL